jgi:hypothetical protein
MVGYEEIKSKNYLKDLFGNQKEANFRYSNFDLIRNGFNTWDYQWAYTRFFNSGLSIVPAVNLVKNLGFVEDATHTSSASKWAELDSNEISIDFRYPKFIIRDKISDDKFALNFTKLSLITIIKKALKRYVY